MTPDVTAYLHAIATNPWLLAYAAGIWTGWTAARRTTAYMIGLRR